MSLTQEQKDKAIRSSVFSKIKYNLYKWTNTCENKCIYSDNINDSQILINKLLHNKCTVNFLPSHKFFDIEGILFYLESFDECSMYFTNEDISTLSAWLKIKET